MHTNKPLQTDCKRKSTRWARYTMTKRHLLNIRFVLLPSHTFTLSTVRTVCTPSITHCISLGKRKLYSNLCLPNEIIYYTISVICLNYYCFALYQCWFSLCLWFSAHKVVHTPIVFAWITHARVSDRHESQMWLAFFRSILRALCFIRVIIRCRPAIKRTNFFFLFFGCLWFFFF